MILYTVLCWNGSDTVGSTVLRVVCINEIVAKNTAAKLRNEHPDWTVRVHTKR